jgi:glucose/arabinose dehydrogenase
VPGGNYGWLLVSLGRRYQGALALAEEALLTGWRHRMRDIRQGPDGLLYVLVDNDDGAILRIGPAL